MILKPKNWGSFQHYKDRNPPWIKLHKTLLSDRMFMRLPLASKALAPLLWLLASESKSENGEFDASNEELEFRLHLTEKEIETGRKPLIDKGFFIIASGELADRLQDACSETETETEKSRKEGKTDDGDLVGFTAFWKAWPTSERKQAKGKCLEAWEKAHAERDAALILAHVERMKQSEDWKKQGGQFIPGPLVYLNQRRWEGACECSESADQFAGAI